MFGENYCWNYDYVRLACDSGFAFKRYPAHTFDKNKICLIDVDRIIREKDVASVENFISCVCQFVLDPEQAQILDENFVKVFRLSQLIIDYLLFCKRYLDKSLTEVKEESDRIKKENKELSLFVEDLQQHVSLLMKEIKEQNAITSFVCEHCNKKFSTEEFLNSHIKRRHSNQSVVPPLDLETDKLHMEIKELKGRLNSTEKLIHQEQNNLKPSNEMESERRTNELKKIDELQQKFEDLRVQVQSELRVLQTQYNFQEKYEKLFEKMTLQNSNVHKKDEVRILEKRRESTTQTEKELNMQESAKEVDVKNHTDQQITELKEALEVKVTTSLEKIESQMQSFWNKLHEMEMPKQSSQNNEEPPSVKPRSKYTLKSVPQSIEELSEKLEMTEESTEESKESESPVKEQTKPEKIIQVDQKDEEKYVRDVKIKVQVKDEISEKTISSDTEIKSIASSEVSEKVVIDKNQQKASNQVTKKRSSKSKAGKKLEVNKELFDHFKEEVENIMVMGRLQDLGVSPEWKGLPTRSFQRALEIVNHKASLMKKTYPDFDKISAQIELEVNNKAELLMKEKNQTNLKKERSEKKKTVSISKKNKPLRLIEIKNKKMYKTDSDSDSDKVTKDNLKDLSTPYSAVIEELKTVTTKYEQSDANEELKNEETKGVLKNYPSVGSLTKKKVLFNLYNNDNYEKKNKEAESTTSITSSILDGSPKKSKRNANIKDIEDLSDFDFSDV